MIHKIKTYEIRSHDFTTKISLTGQLLSVPNLFRANSNFTKAYVRKVALHFQEVLKCMKHIEREREARKLPHFTLPKEQATKKGSMLDTSSTAFNRCSRTSNQEPTK